MADPISLLVQARLRLDTMLKRLQFLEKAAKDEKIGRVARLKAQYLVHQWKASPCIRVFQREVLIAESRARPLLALLAFFTRHRIPLHTDELRMVRKFLA